MIYGNLIFIKKTGGDGSKYPVTERNIKIGRSENCLIRIYNPHVALEHCQLIIEDNGQATLRNLSNQNILNDKSLSNKDVALCHGDIFKLGERLARWEYLPTSKFYKQLLSPTGRLVAVVMPQQRSFEDPAAPGTSGSEVSVLRNTPTGKKRFSERITSENSSVKNRKSSGSELIHKGKGDLQKFLTGHHNLKSAEWVLKGGKVKERKSISGIVGSKTPKGKVGKKCRKSTLPSWKVNIISPSGRKSLESKNLLTKSNRRSTKSPKNRVQISLEDMIKSNPGKLLLSDCNTEVKGSQKNIFKSESLDDSVKNVLKKNVMIEKVLPLNFKEKSTKSTCNLSQSLENAALKSSSKPVVCTPLKVSSASNQNSPLKLGRLVLSESKVISKKHPVIFKGKRKMSLILNKRNSTPRQSSSKRSVNEKKTKTPKIEVSDVSSEILLTPVKNSEISPTKKEIRQKSLKNPLVKSTPKKSERTPRKSLLNKSLKSPDMKTPRKSIITKTPRNLTRKLSKTPEMSISKKVALDAGSQTLPLSVENDAPSAIRSKRSYRKSITAESPFAGETAIEVIKSPGKNEFSPSHQKIVNKRVSAVSASSVDKNFSPANSAQTLTSRSRNSLINTSRTKSSLKAGTAFARGGKRKLSPSSSAERAAKKLKTSSPKKPDKNKKAALLVLGKANRKQLVQPNMKVLLRQKILKKAIKQSMAVVALDDKVRTKAANKVKKSFGKNSAKPKSKKIKKKSKSNENTSPKFLKTSSQTNEEKSEKETPKGKKISASKVLQTSPRLANDSNVQSATKAVKQSEISSSGNSKSFMEKTNTPSSILEKSAENYFLNSNRRCSKRLSYKNDTGRPDFIELSPTALGLIPKKVELFKTPKDNKRRSSSLVTPKNVQTPGIIKAASTSKIGNRKNVRFSSKDVSINSGFCTPNISEKIDFNFSPFETPNITVDVFVSPLMDQSAILKRSLNESKVTPKVKEIGDNSTKNSKSNSVPKTLRGKLQSLSSAKKLNKTFSDPSEFSVISSASLFRSSSKISKVSDKLENQNNNLSELMGSRQLFSTPKNLKSPMNKVSDRTGTRRLFQSTKDTKNSINDLTEGKDIKKLKQSPKIQKSPKNDLTDVRGVKKLMRTPRVQKSPKNDLTDMRGVKKLMRTPRIQKSPKNDLTDVKGVKKLMRTPKVQKSPTNDLTDVRGVKKLMRTPKVQKSPKNDLTDVKGVKKLMRTPKVQKSPKNDLTDVKGVKKLMRTPKVQKSPKNDLTDVKGVKKLMRTPKVQKSPTNDLTDVRGVKKLLRTPKVQKSPKNDLADVRGVKKLMRTPKVQKSPKNDLTDLRGVKKLMRTPKIQKSPKNDLTDVRGVKKLMRTPKVQKSPKNDLTDVRGVKKLMRTPKVQKSPENDLTNISGIKYLLKSPRVRNSQNELPDLRGVKKFVTNRTENKKLFTRSSSQKSSRDRLSEVSDVEKSFESSIVQQHPKNFVEGENVSSSQSQESLNTSFTNAEMKQLLISKSWRSVLKSQKALTRNLRLKDFKSIRGRRTIHLLTKSPKNDLSDVTGVRELFSRHKPISDYNINLTGIAELFDSTKTEVAFEPQVTSSTENLIPESVQNVLKTRTLRRKKILKNEVNENEVQTESSTRLRSRNAAKQQIERKSTRSKKSEAVENLQEEEPIKRKTDGKTKASRVKKDMAVVKRSQRGAKKKTEAGGNISLTEEEMECLEGEQKRIGSSRKRKILLEDVGISPPKLRRKVMASEKSTSSVATETPKKATSRTNRTTSRTGKASGKNTSVVKKVRIRVSNSEDASVTSEVQLKEASKTAEEQIQIVQSKRSQVKSKKDILNDETKETVRKTRSGKAAAPAGRISRTQSVEKKRTRSTAGKKQPSAVVKRSLRRK